MGTKVQNISALMAGATPFFIYFAAKRETHAQT
jgi:hypothetical protein